MRSLRLIVLLTTFSGALCAAAQPAPSLGDAASFAVLGGTRVTNSGSTTVVGNVGVDPGNTVTGFPPGTVTLGRIDTGALAREAQRDLAILHAELSGRPCTAAPLDSPLAPGVYCMPPALPGTLTLNAGSNSGAPFVLRADTLMTAADTVVVLEGGAQAANVYWIVSNAALGARTQFAGNILALTDITLGNGATLYGRALAQHGAVTLDSNSVTICCDPVTLSPLDKDVITASGGKAPYIFAVTPSIWSVSPSGVLTRPSLPPGTYTFTVTATDSRGCSGERTYSLTICPVIELLPLPDKAKLGELFEHAITKPAVELTVTPPMVAGSSVAVLGGVLSWTPAIEGTFSFTVTGCGGVSRTYVVIVRKCTGILPDQLPPGKLCEPYPRPLIFPEEYTLTFVEPPPPELTPELSGTPTLAGSFPYTITASDGFCTETKKYVIQIAEAVPRPIVILPPAAVGMEYTPASIEPGEATGEPPGMRGIGGVLFGKPEKAGLYAITVPACRPHVYSLLVVDCSELTITSPAPPPAIVGVDYSHTFTTIGGATPYTYSTESVLPLDLKLFANGILSGNPTVAGSFALTLIVEDAAGCTFVVHYCSLDVSPASCPPGPPLTLAPDALSPGTLGFPYSDTVVASGGTPPYTFSVTAGALPPGLSLNGATGAISGVPATNGRSEFTITATDANGCIASRCYVIVVATNVPTLSEWALALLSLFLTVLALRRLQR